MPPTTRASWCPTTWSGSGAPRPARMAIALASIHLHPLKSCATLDVAEARVSARGLAHDRRWLAVDGDGMAVTGRTQPRLTLVRARADGDGLQLDAPGMPTLRVPTPGAGAPRRGVRVWDDRIDAVVADARADAWLSDFLGAPTRLAWMDAAARRPIDADGARPGDEVSFADGFPLLLLSQGSLDGLNARLAQPVSMRRFRPNLVVDGVDAHAEDGWTRLRIGGVAFDVVQDCTRCVFTTVDPERGERDASGEPLRTLAGYRRRDAGVTFGRNVIPRGEGLLRVGDEVVVLA